jgi:hypothetical protein
VEKAKTAFQQAEKLDPANAFLAVSLADSHEGLKVETLKDDFVERKERSLQHLD